MSQYSPPAFVISGTSSGSGKTTVALGLMAAYRTRGLRVQPYKCGPDFIDPGLHYLVTKRISRNLDLWMAGSDFSKQSFSINSSDADISIIEGVMGMFDGGMSSSGSLSAEMNLPNILVLDVRSMAESAAAIVSGFETFNPDAKLKGVILNKIGSPRHLELVTDAIESHCDAEILGYLPRTLEFEIPSRHLGLLTADEAPLSEETITLLAKSIEEHVNLDRILELCTASKSHQTIPSLSADKTARIAVARDKAFCFYYEDNFDILRDAGAELVFFSPLNDSQLPDNIDGIYLGGGYPELYAKELSANGAMISSIRSWVEKDGAVYAECGGFMYLTEGIIDHDQTYHSMVGVFPVKAAMQNKRSSLGYREVTTNKTCCFGDTGTVLRGHEFHYSTIGEMPSGVDRIYDVTNFAQEGYQYRRVLGGYMHLHFGFSPDAATAFINFCRE